MRSADLVCYFRKIFVEKCSYVWRISQQFAIGIFQKTNHALREKVSPKDTVADQLSSSQRSDHASKLPTPLMTGENDINYVFSKNLDDGVVEIEAPQHYDELTALLTFRDDDSLWCFEILWSSLNTVEH